MTHCMFLADESQMNQQLWFLNHAYISLNGLFLNKIFPKSDEEFSVNLS